MLIKNNVLIYFYVFIACSIGTTYEIKISGNSGVSVEHSFLLVYIFSSLILSNKKFFKDDILLIFSLTGVFILSLLNVYQTIQSLHLISFIILLTQFRLFFKNSNAINEKLIFFALVLIFIQILFFKNSGEGWKTWDYLVIPGFGVVQRLSILGFVSTSLALMLIPFLIFACHYSKNNRLIGYSLSLIVFSLVFLTYSRLGLLLSILILFFYYTRLMIFLALIISTLSIILIPEFFINLFNFFDDAYLRGNLLSNSRISIWIENFKTMQGFDFIVGKGIMYQPSDNTYLSIFFGGGIILILFVILMFLSWFDFKIPKKKEILLLFFSLLFSCIFIDIFSQRKILFTFALVLGYFIYEKNNSFRR